MTVDSLTNDSPTQIKKKTLLQKYEIPLYHLEFDYIRKCCNVSEVEKIVRILRSGEEGHYPELLECAEKRLEFLCPDHRTLKTIEPIMTKSRLNPEEWDTVHKEIMDWKQEIDDVDNILNQNGNSPETQSFYPGVRRPVRTYANIKKETSTVKKKNTPIDYAGWENYDADKECLKLDLEEEKRAEEKQRREVAEKKKEEMETNLTLEEKEVQAIAELADSLSIEERKVMSIKEKELGNEFYKRNHFNDALKHYTRSIYLHPNAISYNNRAATYLKQCKFSLAQNDLNVVLDMEPDNVKAHFRRALTLQHKNEFKKALDDILFVLQHEPNHVIAKHIASELRDNCSKLPKTHKLKTFDENDPNKVIYTEVSDEEFKEKYKDKKDFVVVNNVNLPKVMCNCNGKHTNDPLLSNNDPIRYQHIRARYGDKANEKIAEMERASKMLKASGGRPNRYMNNLSKERQLFTNQKPLVQPVNISEPKPTTTGGKQIEIVEVEQIEEETTSKIQDNHLDVISDKYNLPELSPNVETKPSTPKEAYLWNNVEDDGEEGKQEEAASILCYGPANDPLPKTKEEKMSRNINMKELLDMSGGGDAATTVSGLDNTAVNNNSSDNSGDAPTPSSDNSVIDSLMNHEPAIDKDYEMKPQSVLQSIAKELFPDETLKKCDCGEGYLIWPSQFETKWLYLDKLANALMERSKLIRLICPHQLSTVISNTLSEDLLAGFIDCLQQHFDPISEREKIHSYLVSITNLQRFKIIYCFLSKNSKCNVNTLLKSIAPISPELEKAFS